jgi:hypothetical protein
MRLILTLVALLLTPVFVFAQIPDPGADAGAFFQTLLGAIAKGQWRIVAILVAIGVVYLLRQSATRLPGALGDFFKSSRGGAVTALLGGVVTALAGLLIGGGPVNVGVLINGIVLGIGAAGGWNVLRRLIWSDAAPVAYPNGGSAPPSPKA